MNTRFGNYRESWKNINRVMLGYFCAVMIWLAMAYLGWISHMQPVCLEKTSSYPCYSCCPCPKHWFSRHPSLQRPA